MDALRLFTGRNHEEVRIYLANAYRGRPQTSGSTFYQTVFTQPSTSRQLPTPAAVRTDITSGLSLPPVGIPQPQARNQSYEDYNTLAPLQLQDSVQERRQQTKSKDAIQTVASESSSSSATNPEFDATPSGRKTLADPQPIYDGIPNFRSYDANGDGGQVELRHDSPGDANCSPRSSPCDDSTNSAESKDETKQEREFFEGSTY